MHVWLRWHTLPQFGLGCGWSRGRMAAHQVPMGPGGAAIMTPSGGVACCGRSTRAFHGPWTGSGGRNEVRHTQNIYQLRLPRYIYTYIYMYTSSYIYIYICVCVFPTDLHECVLREPSREHLIQFQNKARMYGAHRSTTGASQRAWACIYIYIYI